MEKKKSILGISLALVFMVTIGISFAYFSARINGLENASTLSLISGRMTINYNEGPNIELSGIYPKNDAAWAVKTFTLTATNNTDQNMYYKVGIQIEENTFTEGSLTYTLENTLNENGTPIEDGNGTIISGTGTQYLGIGSFINANNKKHTYALSIYFPETEEDQNANQRARFRSKIVINGIEDSTNPTLALDKVTYLAIPFDNTWTYDGAVVEDGVLCYNESYTSDTLKHYAISDYIPVNGDFWYTTYDAFTTAVTPRGNNINGGVYWEGHYYDINYDKTRDLHTKFYDGYSNQLVLNEWNNDIYWKDEDLEAWKDYERYAYNIKYVKIRYAFYGNWSFAPIKIRNLKVWGQMENDFYLINVNATDNEGIDSIKYAKGNKNIEYFGTNGTVVVNNQIRVEENGIYTVYVRDLAGNEVIDTIEITNIV